MRIASFVVAGLIGLLSLGLLAAGGVLLWGDAQKDEHGYLSTARERFATNTYALSTENLDVEADGLDWVLDQDAWGNVRIEADARDKPLFIGIARTEDVSAYLRRSNHELVTDISYSPFRADYRELDGAAKPARPADQDFWAASAHGRGEQELIWDVEDGNWSVVVMNEDASRGIDARVEAGAEVSFLANLGWGAIVAGLVALSLAAALAVAGIRTGRRVAVAA
jgi:hypothetical protein